MVRDETFRNLTTAVSVNALSFLTLNNLHTRGSMNRPRLMGK